MSYVGKNDGTPGRTRTVTLRFRRPTPFRWTTEVITWSARRDSVSRGIVRSEVDLSPRSCTIPGEGRVLRTLVNPPLLVNRALRDSPGETVHLRGRCPLRLARLPPRNGSQGCRRKHFGRENGWRGWESNPPQPTCKASSPPWYMPPPMVANRTHASAWASSSELQRARERTPPGETAAEISRTRAISAPSEWSAWMESNHRCPHIRRES